MGRGRVSMIFVTLDSRSEFLIEFHYSTYVLLCVDYNVPYSSVMTGDIALARTFLVDDD